MDAAEPLEASLFACFQLVSSHQVFAKHKGSCKTQKFIQNTEPTGARQRTKPTSRQALNQLLTTTTSRRSPPSF